MALHVGALRPPVRRPDGCIVTGRGALRRGAARAFLKA